MKNANISNREEDCSFETISVNQFLEAVARRFSVKKVFLKFRKIDRKTPASEFLL